MFFVEECTPHPDVLSVSETSLAPGRQSTSLFVGRHPAQLWQWSAGLARIANWQRKLCCDVIRDCRHFALEPVKAQYKCGLSTILRHCTKPICGSRKLSMLFAEQSVHRNTRETEHVSPQFLFLVVRHPAQLWQWSAGLARIRSFDWHSCAGWSHTCGGWREVRRLRTA